MTLHLHLKRLNRTKHAITILPLESTKADEFSLGPFAIFNMMQDVPIVLTRHSSQNSELARWHGTYTYLPIITSRDLVDAHLTTYETRLVYLQKIREHNKPFMPALMKASTYITVHYRNGIHALSHCMDNVQPRTSSV
jgi:hypothetical protein